MVATPFANIIRAMVMAGAVFSGGSAEGASVGSSLSTFGLLPAEREVAGMRSSRCLGSIGSLFPLLLSHVQVHTGSRSGVEAAWCLHSPSMRLWVRIDFPWHELQPLHAETSVEHI